MAGAEARPGPIADRLRPNDRRPAAGRAADPEVRAAARGHCVARSSTSAFTIAPTIASRRAGSET